MTAGRGKFMCVSTITIPLSEEDLKFLRHYASALGTSAEAFLAHQARNLRRRLQQPLPPEVSAATGIIAPRATEQQHLDHLEKKHT